MRPGTMLSGKVCVPSKWDRRVGTGMRLIFCLGLCSGLKAVVALCRFHEVPLAPWIRKAWLGFFDRTLGEPARLHAASKQKSETRGR